MLCPQSARTPLLPIGENIVTSLCSLIQFQNDVPGHAFCEVQQDGSENILQEAEYQAKVSGRATNANRTSHFRLLLCSRDLVSGLYQAMAEKRIELLDTPGLGGPYWNDEYQLERWIQEFRLLIVCVKADEISARTSAVVNPFLKKFARPIIPVVTFWDCWKTAPDFANISDAGDARIRARELLAHCFPAMADAVDRTLFVSAKNYFDQVAVPESDVREVTAEWNVDNVRRALSAFVEEKRGILKSVQTQAGFLDANRTMSTIAECQRLETAFDGRRKVVLGCIKELHPEGTFDEVLQDSQEHLANALDTDFERIVARLDGIISQGIAAIPPSGRWSQALATIREEVTTTLKNQLSDNFRNRVKNTLDRQVERPLLEYLKDHAPIDDRTLRGMERDIDTRCNEFFGAVSREPGNVFQVPTGVTEFGGNLIAGLIGGFRDLFITNLPLLAVLLFILIAGMFIWPSVAWLVPASFKWVIHLVMVAGAVAYGLTLLGVFWSRFKHVRERTCADIKEKARKQNRREDLESRLTATVSGEVEKLTKNLSELYDDRVKRLLGVEEDMFIEVERHLEDLGQAVKSISSEARRIKRGQ
jgi:hypothetical protein